MAIADRRIQSSKQRVIRQTMERVIRESAAASSIGDFVRVMITGELAKNIAVACKPIQPISRVEIRQSEVLQMGAVPEPTPAPVEARAAAPEAPAETMAEMPAAGEPPAAETESSPEELLPDDL